ncbi:UNVERIFIED_CONTAM: hypothetical protein K2H54_038232 [Gekko kuhli]
MLVSIYGSFKGFEEPDNKEKWTIECFMGKVWKQQMYPQYTTYYYPQYLQAKMSVESLKASLYHCSRNIMLLTVKCRADWINCLEYLAS